MPDMTTHEILVKARELIAVPERWTRGVFARDANGRNPGYPNIQNASCFCAEGAIAYVLGCPSPFYGNPIADACRHAIEQIAGDALCSVNDRKTTTHNQMLDLFERAIASTQERAMPDTYTSSNGSRAVVTNEHDAAKLRGLGWSSECEPAGTNAETMEQAFGSAPMHVAGGIN